MTTTPRAAAYDWEVAYREDPRTLAIQAAIDRIMVTSFPGVAARLAKAAPPVKQESARAVPAVKPEPREPERQELDATVYLTESSSDVDSQAEIDPKEALRELEAKAAAIAAAAAAASTTTGGDVAMADERDDEPAGSADEEDDAEDEEPTACAACHKSDNEKQILLCDGCDGEYHMYCLRPPLTAVPPGDWFCPTCAASRAATSSAPDEPEAMDVDDEPLSDALIRIKQEKSRGLARSSSNGDQVAATSVSIAQTFETDVANSDALLVHACQCAAPRCADATFREFCPLMKRYLRSACWGSHNDKWISYRIATATAELLAYHSLHCQSGPGCNVPLCEELRAEEYV